MIPSHFAVEGFQKKGFAAFGKCFEVFNGRHKMAIRPHIKLAIQAFGRRLNAFKDAEVTRPHTDKPLRSRLIYPSCDFRLEAAAIVGVVELYIINRVAAVFQIACKMPHSRKEKSEADFVLGNIGHFFLDLHHQLGVFGGVKAIKGRRSRVELITKYQNEIAGFFSYPLPIVVLSFQHREIHAKC